MPTARTKHVWVMYYCSYDAIAMHCSTIHNSAAWECLACAIDCLPFGEAERGRQQVTLEDLRPSTLQCRGVLGDGPVHGMHTDMRRAPLGAVPSDMQARRETGR
jgi:hypothetical protein